MTKADRESASGPPEAASDGFRSRSHSSSRLESTWRTISPSHSIRSANSSVFASSGTVWRSALYASARYRSTSPSERDKP